MKKTATLISLSGNLGTCVKLILTFVFLNFMVQKTTAQVIHIDGDASDWSAFPGAHVQDKFDEVNQDNIFAGNEKDFFFASNWFWKLGTAKDKNDIANGAAMLVSAVDTGTGPTLTHLTNGKYLVFAGDRITNDGDAQIGFWFFQDGTAPVEVNGVKTFSPEKHGPPVRGDILVLADFTGGGRNATVIVLEWTPGTGTYDNSNNNFTQITVGAAVAENNGGTTTVPTGWLFTDKKTGSHTQYSQNEFYEGYVDLGVFGSSSVFCPSTYLLETRASQSITATLDDFVGAPLSGAPSCSITGNNTICQGSSACFTASGGNGAFTYSWSGPGGYTATGATICNLTAAGAYSVTVTNALGCTSGCNRTLTVNQSPSCNITGNNTICAGGSASFTASGGGTYLWSTGATTAVISNLTAAGTYSVTVTSGAGCTSACSRTLTVNPTPSCNITGNNTICAGTSASFTASGGGTYLWSTGATGAVLSNLTAAGTYTVTVTSAAGCTSSCSRTLTVNPTPSCDITGNNTICAGTSTSFTASGGGTYLWSTGATGAVISNLTAAGTYSVTVTSAAGCTSSCSRTLTVNPTPSCNITGNNTICAGNSTSFTASGGGTYLWSTGATGAVISNLTAAGTYSVTVTSAAGCTSSCSRELTVITNPTCNILGNNTICAGTSTSFTATGGSSYLWSTGATTAVISNLTAAGTYSVTVTAGGGCTSSCSRTLTVNPTPSCNITGNNTICSYQSASFTASGGGTYLWSTGATSAIISNLTAAGTYSVTVTSAAGCTSSCSRDLTVNNPPSCNITGNNTICAGTSTSFTASGGGTYLWSTGATTAVISNLTAAGTYSVTVTSAQGCTSSCSRTLTVNQNPSVSAGTDPLAQCRATTAPGVFGTNTFTVTGSNVQNAVLAVPAWTVAPGGNPQGFTVNIVSPNSLSTNVQLSGNVNGGTVRLILTVNSNATPSCGTATDDVLLTVNPLPLIKTLVGSNFCPNVISTGSVTLQNAQAGVSYQLYNDAPAAVQAPKVAANAGDNLTWTGLPEGNYTVVGTFLATSCNSTSGPASVVENPVPDVTITPVDDPLCNEQGAPCVTLAALPAGGQFSGTGVTNGQFCPAGLAPGAYTVTYSYTNAQGCSSSASISIDVVSCNEPICTYTQGYFGNEGGTSCDGTNDGFTTTALINQSIANWGGLITIGCGTKKVTIATGQASCVIDKLPGGGPSKELTATYTICSVPSDIMKNTLLAQTIALGLNIGITSPSDLSNFALQAGTLSTAEPVGGCGSNVATPRICHYDPVTHLLTGVENPYLTRTFSQALIDAIEDAGYPKTVGGLFSLASDALCNKDNVLGSEQGVSLSEIAGAAGSINEVFDECRISVGWNVPACPPSDAPAPARITVTASAEATQIGKLKVSTFPNPYRDQVRFVIESPVAGPATLDVYNLAGQKVQTLFNGHIDANETRYVDYRPSTAVSGMLIYKLRIGSQVVTGKLVGLKQ